MKTLYNIYFSNSYNMSEMASDSIDLVVTSPPMLKCGMCCLENRTQP